MNVVKSKMRFRFYHVFYRDKNEQSLEDFMKAFIYDMDGVIVDSEPVHLRVEKHILETQGVKDVTWEELEA